MATELNEYNPEKSPKREDVSVDRLNRVAWLVVGMEFGNRHRTRVSSNICGSSRNNMASGNFLKHAFSVRITLQKGDLHELFSKSSVV